MGAFVQARLLRATYPGCTTRFAGVGNPSSVIDAARGGAAAKTAAAVGSVKSLRSATINLLDRHFHCPSVSQIRKVIARFDHIKAALPTLSLRCGDPDCAGTVSGVLRGGTVHLCSRFFQRDAEIQAGVLVEASARRTGLKPACKVREACYDDFTLDASSMTGNSYSYAYFALEAAGYALPQPSTIPCRPLRTGVEVVVPPDAVKDPKKIRRLTGFDRNPRGSVILPVYVDQAGNYFIYHGGLPGARVFMPDEQPRYYFAGKEPPG